METEEARSGKSIFSGDIQADVMAQLELILASPSFAQSNRCKNFLHFVVLETLSGNASQLKERTIGINVFGRALDYDTGSDSIVRVTSNEVRKRIDQFYRESPIPHPIQIELIRGSYVPEFRICPVRLDDKPIGTVASNGSGIESIAAEAFSTVITPPAPMERNNRTDEASTRILPTSVPVTRPMRKRWRFPILLALVLIGGIAAILAWRNRAANRIPQIWEAFHRSNVPVLICLGTHDDPSVASPQDAEQFSDQVLRKQIIPADDVTVIAAMASLLGKKGIPFRVVGASQTSLTDLRRQPVILIGAADNQWTLRLSQDLRYRINFVPPGQNRVPIASIVDSDTPSSTPWTFNFSIPMNQWKIDYAIVARVNDPATGIPMLIDAGLGNAGSLAASEFIASDDLPKGLAAEPSCRGKSNFEAVISTDIIDARPGPPHILRLQCW